MAVPVSGRHAQVGTVVHHVPGLNSGLDIDCDQSYYASDVAVGVAQAKERLALGGGDRAGRLMHQPSTRAPVDPTAPGLGVDGTCGRGVGVRRHQG